MRLQQLLIVFFQRQNFQLTSAVFNRGALFTVFCEFDLNKITNPNESQVELNRDGQIQVNESLDQTQDNNSLEANIGTPVSDGELLDETNDSSIITAEVEVLENGLNGSSTEAVRLLVFLRISQLERMYRFYFHFAQLTIANTY